MKATRSRRTVETYWPAERQGVYPARSTTIERVQCVERHTHARRCTGTARGDVLNFVSRVGQKYATTDMSTALAGRLLALAAACFICTHARVDPDLWGHLRFGLDTASSHRLSITDPYSFTQDVPWINHEWLSETTQAIAYRTGGVLGMMLLKVVL